MDHPAAKKPKLDHCSSDDIISISHDCVQSESDTNVFKDNHLTKDSVVKESNVGITEFISDHQGFQGIIKQRYSDFLVNEINLNGDVVRLTNTEIPVCDVTQESKAKSCFESVLTDEQSEDLKLLAEGKTKNGNVLIEVGDDKKRRSDIHQAIREQFCHLISQTENINGKKCIIVTRVDSHGNSESSGGWKRSYRQPPWQHKDHPYCHSVLYKENKDTMFAVNLLAKYLGVRPSVITYAGTKDKRAKTCQQLAFYKVTATRLHALNKKLRDMTLGNFRYKKESLALGDLKGNHFVIVLRRFVASDEQLEKAMSSLSQYGFINYYGMQRFGTTSVPTHLVGRSLLKSSWQEAIDLIMKPRLSGVDPIFEVRQCWWNEHDATKALAILGKRICPERHLLNGLKNKSDNDYVGALGCIPRNNRLIYVHAYQSYLWNKLTSERIKQHGLKPVEGDLVIPTDIITDINTDITDEVPENTSEKMFVEPTIVTKENISQFTIHNVVLPLVGYDVIYPVNAIGQLYKTWLQEDGLSQEDLKHKVKDYSLRGAYRHIVVRPKDLEWAILQYEDPNVPLVLSDLEKLKRDSEPDEVKGSFKALKLEFSLPPSAYATMALREVLKQDTSASYQTMLTTATMEISSSLDTTHNSLTKNNDVDTNTENSLS